MRVSSRCLIRRLALGALMLVSGCMAWHSRGPAAQAVLADHPADRARVTLTDGSVLLVRSPRAVGDSLIGWTGDSTRVAIPGARIRNIETRSVDLWRTGGTVFLVSTVMMAAVVIVLIAVLVHAAR